MNTLSPNHKMPLNSLKKAPRVEATNPANRRNKVVDSYIDIYNTLKGFKDGVVLQTGTTKLALCNGNLSDVATVFYHNWTAIFTESNRATNWYDGAWATGMKLTTEQIMYAMQWPFFSFYSCYWASNDLAIRYEDQEVDIKISDLIPQVRFQGRDMILFEQVLLNAIFNAGFIIGDISWLIEDEWDLADKHLADPADDLQNWHF